MKVLLINVNGSSGSTGKIVTDIKNTLELQGHECMIAYGANNTVDATGYYRLNSEEKRKLNAATARFTGILYGYFPFSGLKRLKSLIEVWKPDIVNIHCANGCILNLFKTLEYLAEQNIRTVVTNHAEFIYTGGCGHAYDCNKWLEGCKGSCPEIKGLLPIHPARVMWTKFNDAFSKFDVGRIFITSVSPWVQNRAKRSPALSRFRHAVVMNGLETAVFRPRSASKDVEGKLPKGKPIALHVTAQFTTQKTNKGGNWVVELARLLPEINFVIAATYLGVIDNLPNNVIIWGRTKDQIQLAELYTCADVTVISSYRETFSMVTAESLCCGTPVVGFQAGGPESISPKEYGIFVPYGDLNAVKAAIYITIEEAKDSTTISALGQDLYSKERMTTGYLEVYNELLS